ncbi:high mobility group B protein 6-like [Magnolia sinica]|uniref:high mobility group B protein 6-like n=1 Tax=Magnolia sinica TaxID=86752 RepID=UPI0026598F0A|nr:high mobility group B protein 6-like [Magnolia sinica]
MANATANMPKDVEVIPTKKGRTRKPLKPRKPSENEGNILAGNPSPSPQAFADAGKENQDGLRLLLSPKKTKPASKTKNPKQTFNDELQEMQEKLQKMRLEKEKTEELLKERDEMLKRKEEELENRGKEQEKLQLELKKLQKLKEFKPTMSFPLVKSLREKEEERKDKKKKKACPENKKPSPAYILWCKDQWNEVKKEKPDADFKEISNILGGKWKNLSAEEKKPYEEKYQADKESYLQVVGKEKREKEALNLLEEEQKQKMAMELLEQYLQFKQEADKENKKTRKERDPLKPKQPLTAFFLYSNERRVALLTENKNVLEVSKLLGEEWKNLSEEKRAPYEEIAKKQREDYLQQMELYKQKKNEETAALQKEDEEQRKVQKQEALQLLKKKEKTENIVKKTKEKRKKQKEMRKVDPNKPKKPATSFLLFSKETRKELLEERPGINNSTLSALISVKWKELNQAEKQIWNDKASKAMVAYKKELEEYNNKTAVAVDCSDPHS